MFWQLWFSLLTPCFASGDTPRPVVLRAQACASELAASPAYNENATISADRYPAVTWRNLEEIKFLLEKDFRSYVETIPRNAPVLLPGGGYGIYGLELANLGHPVVMVNPQNFYTESLAQLINDPLPPLVGNQQNGIRLDQFGNVKPFVLNRLANALGVKLPNSLEPPKLSPPPYSTPEFWYAKPGTELGPFVGDVQSFVARVLLKLEPPPHRKDGAYLYKSETSSGSVFLIQKLVQEVSPESFKEQTLGGAALLIDFMDAYTYSSKKVELLLHYHAMLRPGGRAYIQVPDGDDQVKISSEPETFQDLSDYLAERIPQIRLYQVSEPHPMRVLVLEKNDQFRDPDWIKGMLEEDSLKVWSWGEGRMFPLATYRPRR